MNYYFDKSNDYDGSEDLEIDMIDKNFFEYSVGVEYALTQMIKLSAGYSGTQTGVNENYQSDQRYSLNTNTFGGGIGLTLSPMIDINLGGMWTMYQDGSVNRPQCSWSCLIIPRPMTRNMGNCHRSRSPLLKLTL